MHVCYITHVLSCSESGHVISVRQDRCSTFVLYLGLGFGLGLGLVLAVAARESAFKRIEIYCLLLKYRSNVFFSLCYGNVIASWVRGNKIVTCALHTCWQDPCFPFSKFYLK